MTKLSDMFVQARRGQSGGGIGFLGRNRPAAKPRAAALIAALPAVNAGSAESAIKAGANGLLFTWDGENTAQYDALKAAAQGAQAADESAACGLRITGGWKGISRETLETLKDQGLHYVVLPLSAPARLLGAHIKDLDIVVEVPLQEGDLYPIFVRNLSAFENVSAVYLDFAQVRSLGNISIEEALHYRAVREALRYPALLNVGELSSEADAYTLTALGAQAVVQAVSATAGSAEKQIQGLRDLLEKAHQEEKEEAGTPSIPTPPQSPRF